MQLVLGVTFCKGVCIEVFQWLTEVTLLFAWQYRMPMTNPWRMIKFHQFCRNSIPNVLWHRTWHMKIVQNSGCGATNEDTVVTGLKAMGKTKQDRGKTK
jgi:hypothetical protein